MNYAYSHICFESREAAMSDVKVLRSGEFNADSIADAKKEAMDRVEIKKIPNGEWDTEWVDCQNGEWILSNFDNCETEVVRVYPTQVGFTITGVNTSYPLKPMELGGKHIKLSVAPIGDQLDYVLSMTVWKDIFIKENEDIRISFDLDHKNLNVQMTPLELKDKIGMLKELVSIINSLFTIKSHEHNEIKAAEDRLQEEFDQQLREIEF